MDSKFAAAAYLQLQFLRLGPMQQAIAQTRANMAELTATLDSKNPAHAEIITSLFELETQVKVAEDAMIKAVEAGIAAHAKILLAQNASASNN